MRALTIFLFSFVLRAADPVISNVVLLTPTTDWPSHSCAGFAWDTDSNPDLTQIVYGATSGYGSVDGPYANTAGGIGSGHTRQYVSCGHTPGSTVHFSPQSKVGAAWSNTIDQVITFDAAPDPDPALPIEPAASAVTSIDTTGYTTVSPACVDLPAAIQTAINNQLSAGTIINVSAGSNCPVPFTLFNRHPASKAFTASSATEKITSAGHGYLNGYRIRFSGVSIDGGFVPTPLVPGKDYCVAAKSTDDFEVADYPACGASINLTSNGSPGAQYVMIYPPPGNFVQIRSSAADSALPPAGVQINSDWGSSIATLAGSTLGLGSSLLGLFKTGPFTSKIAWGPGIQFDVADTDGVWVGTTDPKPLSQWFDMAQLTSGYWYFDRVRFETGWPRRVHIGMSLEGSDLTIVNSDFKNVAYGLSYTLGYSCAATGATMTCISTSASAGAGSFFTCTGLPTFSVTITGGTGAGSGWFDIPSTCTPRVTLQSGVTATCSGCTLNVGTVMPRNVGNSYTGVPLIQSDLGASSWSNTVAYDFNSISTSQYVFDGAHSIIGSFGFGPLLIKNTTFTDAGLINIHLDESSTIAGRFFHDVTMERLRMSWTPTHVNRWAWGVNPLSDGLFYNMRQQWECKLCGRTKLKGIRMAGNYGGGITGGFALEVFATAASGPVPNLTLGVHDFQLLSSSMTGGSSCLSINGGNPHSLTVGLPVTRARVSNLFCGYNNAYLYSTAAGSGRMYGFQLSNAAGGQDIIIENSTFLSTPGSFGDWNYAFGSGRHGTTLRNNIFTFNGSTLGSFWEPSGSGLANSPSCAALSTSTETLNCYNRQLFTWGKNVLVAGYTDSENSTGNIDASTVVTSYTGLATSPFIRQEATYPLRLAAMKYWSSTNARLGPTSPYVNTGIYGGTVGADLDLIEDDQGLIKNIRALPPTSTAFTAAFHAPDASTSCYIGYGTAADVTTWSRTSANTAASRERTIAVTGLTTKTVYNWQVWCQDAAPSATQTLRTP